jgi:opacity protein-like surface antigen
MRRRLVVIAAISSLCALATPARAQDAAASSADFPQLLHARSLGMAGAYRALGYGADTVYGNPAAMVVSRRYLIETSGLWGITAQQGQFSTAMMDSKTTEYVAAGLGYNLVIFGPPDARTTAHLTTLALAVPLADFLSIGVSGRHQVMVGGTNTNSITMAAGLLIKIGELVHISASGHNLIGVWNRYVQRYFAFGLSAAFGLFTPCLEVRLDFNDPARVGFAIAGGVEWIVGGALPLRAGYSFDNIYRTQMLSFGTGYFAEGSGVDIAYQVQLVPFISHTLALTLKLQINE